MRNYENFSTRNRDALSLTCKRFGKSIVEKRVAELMSFIKTFRYSKTLGHRF
jgi:hypothetical protein